MITSIQVAAAVAEAAIIVADAVETVAADVLEVTADAVAAADAVAINPRRVGSGKIVAKIFSYPSNLAFRFRILPMITLQWN